MSQNLTRKKAMLKALEKSLGIVTDAAQIAGIDRENHYRWLKDDEEYKKKVDAIENIVLDFSESQLYKRIEKEDTTAIIFHLKTKGKKRGYIEKTEYGFTDKDGNDILVAFNPSKDCEPLTDAENKVIKLNGTNND